MEFLDKLVIPQPSYNLELMNYLLLLGLAILLIYSGILLGSVFFSVLFKKDEPINTKGNRLSLEYTNLLTANSANAFGLGIIPFMAIIFIYAQLLHQTHSNVTGLLFVSFIIYLLGLLLVYRYKKSANLFKTFKNIESKFSGNEEETNEVKSLSHSFEQIKNSSGKWGVVCLFLSLWLLIGSVAYALEAVNSGQTTNLIWLVLSTSATIKFIHFLTASIAGTAISYLFVKFFWAKDELNLDDEEYNSYSKKLNLKIAMLASLIMPFMFVIDLITTPKYALTPFVFVATFLGVLAVFIVLHFIYAMFRENNFTYIKYSFFIFIIAFALVAVKEKTAFGTAGRQHYAVLNEGYKIHKEEFLASLGREEAKLDGAELYQRCKACHDFERRLVGPPHKEVLPKYMDNKEALVRFILNPTKINPDYPPMPNQGLRPNEAEAIVEYLFEHYGPELKEGE